MSAAARPPAIRPDQRLLVVGKTGTGKSTLARWLWATQYGPRSGHRWRVLVDVEDIYELVPEKGVWQGSGEPDWRAEVIRWFPRNASDVAEYEALYRQLNARPGVATWNDEVTASSPQSKPVPEQRHYQLRGRKHGRAHIACTQFPVLIDRTYVDQCEHIFMFQVKRPEDVDRLGKMVGVERDALRDRLARLPRPEPDDGGPSHGFLWHADARDRLVERAPLTAAQLAQADRLVIARK